MQLQQEAYQVVRRLKVEVKSQFAAWLGGIILISLWHHKLQVLIPSGVAGMGV